MPRATHRLIAITLLAGLALLRGQWVAAHPLQAEPVEHPYVFAFDQFYLPEDPDEHVVGGGVLLLAELRCTACHPGNAQLMSAAPGPDLLHVGSRLPEDAIWRMVRSPQHTKKGTLMPGLFTNVEGDDEDVEALTEFLSSLKRPEPVTMPVGDADRGKKLYHEVGCVACHEPATDFRPATVPPDSELERPGLASVPIVLAEAYDRKELAAFLADPLESRPHARMPAQLRNAQEAADVAAYLQLGETFEAAAERSVLNIPPQGIERGRQVFHERHCQACHEMNGEPIHPPGKRLVELTPDRGCLSGERTSGIPFYNLTELQTRAMRLALEHIRQAQDTEFPHDRVDWQMMRHNCYACHDWNGKGGPEDPRAQYFSNQPLPVSPGFHPFPMPPSLDGVSDRLSPEGILQALRGRPPMDHPETTVRMPDFGPKFAIPFQAQAAEQSIPTK